MGINSSNILYVEFGNFDMDFGVYIPVASDDLEDHYLEVSTWVN